MDAKSIRILLVEDDEHDRVAFRRAFKKARVPAEIAVCEQAEDALERIRTDTSSFDLVVVDHKLPGMSGLDLCKTVLGEEIPLPLVILTGKGSEAVAVEAMKAGTLDYVVKSQAALSDIPRIISRAMREWDHITERKRAEEAARVAHKELAAKTEELERINAELSEYSSAVSHDIRAPLRAIHNYADFLREDLAMTLDGEQKEYLDGLCKAVHQGEALVTDLLALYRVGTESLETESIDIGDFLRELIASADLPEEVEIKAPDEWPTIDAPLSLMRQIFQNLIDNAVKFNRSARKLIELGWRTVAEDHYEIFVRDNGIGVEPQYLEQIFGIFQRLHTKDQVEGTGIGLALVKKTVTMLGGSIRVESTPGEGSTFFVTLPKKAKESQR